MVARRDFADYCCELLASVGAVDARRMFGGWGLRLDGLTIAVIADLGAGAKLWLKADVESRGRFEAAGCERFSYTMPKGGGTVARGMNYYSVPTEAMESAQAMAPWARLALASALKGRLELSSAGAARQRAGKTRAQPRNRS